MDRILVIRLKGGLGNQLFQYAIVRRIQLSCNVKIFIDLSNYNNYIYNLPPQLKFFRGSENVVFFTFHNKHLSFLKIGYQLAKYLNVFLSDSLKFYVREPEGFKREILKSSKFHPFRILDGIFGHESYFSTIQNYLSEELLLHDEIHQLFDTDELFSKYSEKALDKETWAIHFRAYYETRTESDLWINDPNHYVNYYKKAFRLLKSNYTPKHILIFSDHAETFIRRFPEIQDFSYEIVKPTQIQSKVLTSHGELDTFGYNTLRDFLLLQKFKNTILGASSYSWWAAWLNELNNLDSINIIAPDLRDFDPLPTWKAIRFANPERIKFELSQNVKPQ